MRNLNFILVLFLIIFGMSCNNEDVINQNAEDNIVSLKVKTANFSSTIASRVFEDGYKTEFENNDKAGLIAVSPDGSIQEDCNNIECTFNDEKWSLGSDCNYVPGSTYILYFPYDSKMTGKKSIEEIEDAFEIKNNQSAAADYRSSDLMAGKGVWDNSNKSLNFDLKHCFSMITVNESLGQAYVSNGVVLDIQNDNAGSQTVTAATVTISDKEYTLYKSEGSTFFRAILPKGENTFTLKLTMDDQEKTVEQQTKTFEANTFYPLKSVWVDYANAGITRIGDFLCKTETGWYLVAKEADLTADDNCVGIVFYAGDMAVTDDTMLKSDFSGCNNGLAVSLTELPGTYNWNIKKQEGSDVKSTMETINNNFINQDEKWEKDIMKNHYKFVGYTCTKALKEYNLRDGKDAYDVYMVEALDLFEPIPETSGWYIPSFAELVRIYSSKDYEFTVGTTNCTLTLGEFDVLSILNNSLSKIESSNSIYSTGYYNYTTCSEYPIKPHAYYSTIRNKIYNTPTKNTVNEYNIFRPICAF